MNLDTLLSKYPVQVHCGPKFLTTFNEIFDRIFKKISSVRTKTNDFHFSFSWVFFKKTVEVISKQ